MTEYLIAFDEWIPDHTLEEPGEHLGGFLIVDVGDEAEARHWAGKVAVACGWPREVRPLPDRARSTKSGG